MTFRTKISIAAVVCTFGLTNYALAGVTATSGTGRDWAKLCSTMGTACAPGESGGGLITYQACTKSQCYTVSCSSEDSDKICIKEESPSARVGTRNRQAVRRLLGTSVVQNNTGNSSSSGSVQGANSAGGGSNVGGAAPASPTKGSGGGGCNGGVC